eukprot:COSAG01_NODE_12064_length_1806_cov_1.121265_3_plen_63_part_01
MKQPGSCDTISGDIGHLDMLHHARRSRAPRMHPISTLSQLFVYTIYRIFSLVQDRLGRTSLGI